MSKVTSFYDKRCVHLQGIWRWGVTWCDTGRPTHNCYGDCPYYKAVGVMTYTTNETQEEQK